MDTIKAIIENKKQDWWDASFIISENTPKFRQGKRIHLKQHKSCSSVFHTNEREYIYLNAILFLEEEESENGTFTSNRGVFLDEKLQETIDSAQEIRSFPFIEKNFIVKVNSKKIDKKTVFFVKNKRELEEVWKYYKHPRAKKLLIERL